jgi:hypothetical protein
MDRLIYDSVEDDMYRIMGKTGMYEERKSS